MAEFKYQIPFPLGEDTTSYRLLSGRYVNTAEWNGRKIIEIEPEGIRLLAREAFSHYQAPASDPQQRRAGLLVQAQLAMAIAAGAMGSEPAHWRSTASQLLAGADALAPLVGEHRAWQRALTSKP